MAIEETGLLQFPLASICSIVVKSMKPSFYEFFAGGGMVRAGLGTDWQCVFANDFDHKKGRMYRWNWGDRELKTADVGALTTLDLPGEADLAWASFPCQDLSLAGAGAGLKGDRSGTFWPFWGLMKRLMQEGRAPRVIVLENVCGALTAHQGKDFTAICAVFQEAGYAVGALVVDAALFVPQSRPRLFVIAMDARIKVPEALTSQAASSPWHTRALIRAQSRLPEKTQNAWIWWRLPLPPKRKQTFADIVQQDPKDVPWFTEDETQQLLSMMSPINLDKVLRAQQLGRRMVGGVYKRTRPDGDGQKVQRAEVRFDDVSGCLRTPAGGSSRQVIIVVEGQSIKARLVSSRETARLMGLPDTYVLPQRYNEAYHLTGDGVVVPVVEHLAKHIFKPLIQAVRATITAAA